MIISVIGSSTAKPEHAVLAEEVGRELARRGIMVACGGMTGVMEAACRGAKAEGGTTIGILPGRRGSPFNSYVDIPIFTTLGYARNIIVVHSGEACIAIGGAFGTLSEIAYALDAKIPVIGLNSWPLTIKGDGDPIVDGVLPAGDPKDAVDKAIAAATGAGNTV
ncbi:MAG: TIGR00725 family protein [Chloroflexi bacterium]|nr:TIGR00725 family protein [Chloroflexota bacterium]